MEKTDAVWERIVRRPDSLGETGRTRFVWGPVTRSFKHRSSKLGKSARRTRKKSGVILSPESSSDRKRLPKWPKYFSSLPSENSDGTHPPRISFSTFSKSLMWWRKGDKLSSLIHLPRGVLPCAKVKVRVYLAGLASPTGIVLYQWRWEKRTTSRKRCIRLRQTQLLATREHAARV